MEPFFRICLETPKLCLLESNEQVQTKHGLGHVCPNLVADDSHIIQIHTTNMEMFVSTRQHSIRSSSISLNIELIKFSDFSILQDTAMLHKEQMLQEASPAIRKTVDHICPPEGLLTPPATNRKFTETHPDSEHK